MPEDWDEDLADIIEELVCRANCNEMPVSEAEWEDVCQRFGVDLYLVRARSRHAGIVLDDVIVVKRSLEPGLTQQRIAHELSEYLLCSDWHSPYVVPVGSLDEQRHHVARLVEQRLRVMQAARRRTVQQQMQAIAQRRATLEQQHAALAQQMQQIQAQIAAEMQAEEAAAQQLDQM